MIWNPSRVFSTVAFGNRATWRKRRARTVSRAASRAGEGWGLKDVIAESGSNKAAGPTSTSTSWRADRKSTRLNSSHLGISYAVFCLKKKNHQEASQTR